MIFIYKQKPPLKLERQEEIKVTEHSDLTDKFCDEDHHNL